MPKLTNRLPKYSKHSASGQAVVSIGGKDHYLGPFGSAGSRKKYDQLIREYLAAGRTVTRQPTVTELIAAFWKHAERYYVKNGKPTSEIPLHRIALRELKSSYGRELAEEFGPLKLKAIRAQWIAAGHARSTINGQIGRIKRVFKWGVSEELVPAPVYQALATVSGLAAGRSAAKETPPVGPVDVAVVEKTLPYLSPTVAAMVRFQLLTGARPAEVCKLCSGNIDRNGDVWAYRVEGHKTVHHGRERIIYIGPAAQAVLAPYLDGPGACFSPAQSAAENRARRTARRTTAPGQGNGIGTNRKAKPKRQAGDQFSPASYRRAITRACKLAKVDHWHPNQLRHTAATLIRRRFGLEHAQVTLGHADAQMTLVYAEQDSAKARDVAREIG